MGARGPQSGAGTEPDDNPKELEEDEDWESELEWGEAALLPAGASRGERTRVVGDV